MCRKNDAMKLGGSYQASVIYQTKLQYGEKRFLADSSDMYTVYTMCLPPF